MTTSDQAPQVILLDERGRAAYAVPLRVVESHRATPHQQAEIEAAMGETEGFTLPPDASTYLLPAHGLDEYRLSDEQRASLEPKRGATMGEGDVSGYWGSLPGISWGYGPNGTIVITTHSLPGVPGPPSSSEASANLIASYVVIDNRRFFVRP